jgi:hypothetical protein
MAVFVIRRSCLPALALAAAGCSDEPATPAPERTPAGAPTAVASNPAPDEPFRYTHLSGDGCTVIESVPDEAGYFVEECAGEGGYRLRHSEADLRQDLVVLAPGGGEHELGLTTMAGGAFNSLGDTVEWRGEAEGGRFTPTALIVRQGVQEDIEANRPDVSYLVVVRLRDRPCVVARIRPGSSQNERARAAADAPGECLTDQS